MKVRLPGGLTERQVAGIERAIKSCPAYGTLLHPPPVEISIDGLPEPAPEGPRIAAPPGLG